MATPTPGKHASAQVGATPPVSTPFSGSHLAAFSPRPGPRSVGPSPQQLRKSPATSQTIYGHPSTSSYGGLSYDSPSAAAALGGLPSLGDMQLDGSGGGGFASGLLLGSRSDEDEQKRKLQQVLDILRVDKGHVSEEGLERLAKRIGLECLWEASMGGEAGTGTLVIAGSAVSIDIVFSNHLVSRVALSFHEASEYVSNHTDKAGRVLFGDLQVGPGESLLTKKLDKFAANLELLAALDKLSVIPGLNCHEAIAGIYESLKKLHGWEVARLREQSGQVDRQGGTFEKLVTCKESGRPVMHGGGAVGLSLEFWQDRHLVPTATDSGDMAYENPNRQPWSLLIHCAPMTSIVFSPIRVSDKWISADIRKSDLLMGTAETLIDWQEPGNTLLPATDAAKADGVMDSLAPKFPEVIFVARFEPAITLPYNVAAQLYASVGTVMESYAVSTFDGLLFPPAAGGGEKTEPGERTISRRRKDVAGIGRGRGRKKNTGHDDSPPGPSPNARAHHEVSVFVEKTEYGRALTDMPFSHPRQLVEMLPTLRQYAFLSRLLHRSLGSPSPAAAAAAAAATTASSAEPKNAASNPRRPQKNTKDSLAAFLSSASSRAPSQQAAQEASIGKEQEEEEEEEESGNGYGYGDADGAGIAIDISLSTLSPPRLHVVFPLVGAARTANVVFEIGLNAAVTVVSQNIDNEEEEEEEEEEGRGDAGGGSGGGGPREEKGRRRLTPAQLARMLEVAEDVSIFAEFVRRKVSVRA